MYKPNDKYQKLSRYRIPCLVFETTLINLSNSSGYSSRKFGRHRVARSRPCRTDEIINNCLANYSDGIYPSRVHKKKHEEYQFAFFWPKVSFVLPPEPLQRCKSFYVLNIVLLNVWDVMSNIFSFLSGS